MISTATDTLPNAIMQGDCIDLMGKMPRESVDFILTDPPYLCRYKDRSGRTVANDGGNAAWLRPAFAQMHRVLKPDAFCVSFYGWHQIDLFMGAWRAAGFRPVGHIVFTKTYASKTHHLRYQHESAYLLAKGNPAAPERAARCSPLEIYRQSSAPDTEAGVSILTPLIEAFTQPGDTVLDPFCGSGSTLFAAKKLGRRYIGMEIEDRSLPHRRRASAAISTPAGGRRLSGLFSTLKTGDF